jgi:DNA-binding PadR family transcriptional regulator
VVVKRVSADTPPLSAHVLQILLALADEDRHGYAIMQEVARQSDGRYTLGPGSLYDNVARLLDQGLIREASRRDAEDARRRYYQLTSSGRGALAAEIARLEAQFRKAKPHLRPAHGRAR